MLLTCMSQNLLFGGVRNGAGDPEDRWPLLLERIQKVKPDILLLQEAWDWGKYGHKHLVQAKNDLGMEAMPLPASNSGSIVAILYRPDTMGSWQRWNTDYADQTTHGFGVASFNVGLQDLISFMSVHLDPFRLDMALLEIGLISNRAYRYSPLTIIGGDINYAPARGPEPNYEAMKPFNMSARTVLQDKRSDKPMQPDRRIGQKLEQAGFVDVAYHLYEKTKDEGLLARTATDDRIDQFWVSEPLAPAIAKYWVVDTPAEASDHKGVAFQLDTDKIVTSDTWGYH